MQFSTAKPVYTIFFYTVQCTIQSLSSDTFNYLPSLSSTAYVYLHIYSAAVIVFQVGHLQWIRKVLCYSE